MRLGDIFGKRRVMVLLIGAGLVGERRLHTAGRPGDRYRARPLA
jgi:hypothetical protein